MIHLVSQASEIEIIFVEQTSRDSHSLVSSLRDVISVAFPLKCLEQLNAFYYPRSSSEGNKTHWAVPSTDGRENVKVF